MLSDEGGHGRFCGWSTLANHVLKHALPVPSIDRKPRLPLPSLIKDISSSFFIICLQFENVALYAAILTLGELFHVIVLRADTILTCHSSVPTKDQVLVPETLLKKRKSQEAARAERRAEAEKKKKVGSSFLHALPYPFQLPDDNTNHATRPTGQCCRFVNHLSGLTHR